MKLDAVTFDHWKTLGYARGSKGDQEDFRLLSRRIHEQLSELGLRLSERNFTSVFLSKWAKLNEITKQTQKDRPLDEIVGLAVRSLPRKHALPTKKIRAVVGSAALRWGLEDLTPVSYPGTKELLTYLHGRYKLGVISNWFWPPLTKVYLERMEMNSFFETVVVSAEYGYAKPSRRIFRYALSKLGVAPHRCLHVGDSFEQDIIGAMRAGMRTAHIAKSHGDEAVADFSLKKIYDLKRFL